MEITTALLTLFGCLGVMYLGFWRFRQLHIDEFRQNVFALRDELFDFVLKNEIEFAHPAHLTLRNLMNGYIRFSHQLSLTRFVTLIVYTRVFNRSFIPKQFNETWEVVTTDLDEHTKQAMQLFLDKATFQLFNYLFIGSMVKKILVSVIVLLAVAILASISFLQRLFSAAIPQPVPVVWPTNPRNSEAQTYQGLVECPTTDKEDFETLWSKRIYKFSTEHSEKVKDSIESFNTGASAYGGIVKAA